MGIDQSSGVDYKRLDFFKVKAQSAAVATDDNSRYLGVATLKPSRGESAFLFRNGDHYIAYVEEGLGTKVLVADAVNEQRPGSASYSGVGQDTVAMIVNDMITLGALPIAVAMHLAVGGAQWFDNQLRAEQLIEGWKHACDLSSCTWGCGETPELQGIVYPETVLLSGSAVGKTLGLRWFNPAHVAAGDTIVFCESSGPHANGYTKARAIAGALPDGYATPVPGGGKTYGEELLAPTHLYVPVVRACLEQNIDVHYAVNITGHGWRKLMRGLKDLRYIVHTLPRRMPVFDFIKEHSGLVGEALDDEAMFGSYNMGVGFGLYMPRRDAARFFDIAKRSSWPFRVFEGGYVEPGERRVVIEPKGIEFKTDTLNLR